MQVGIKTCNGHGIEFQQNEEEKKLCEGIKMATIMPCYLHELKELDTLSEDTDRGNLSTEVAMLFPFSPFFLMELSPSDGLAMDSTIAELLLETEIGAITDGVRGFNGSVAVAAFDEPGGCKWRCGTS